MPEPILSTNSVTIPSAFTPRTFVSWFGEDVPHRGSPLYREDYRPFYIHKKAYRQIEGYNLASHFHDASLDMPVGYIFKFGPYVYQVVSRKETPFDCLQCDLGYHCSCSQLECSKSYRKDKTTVGYKRLVIDPRKLPPITLTLKDEVVSWSLFINENANTFHSWPASGCTISFILKLTHKDGGVHHAGFFVDEDTKLLWFGAENTETNPTCIPSLVTDVIFQGKSIFHELREQFHEKLKEVSGGRFYSRTNSVESLDDSPIQYEQQHKDESKSVAGV